MPRRYLGVRNPTTSNTRMVAALDVGIEAPNIDEIIESQDLKLQEIKRLVFGGTFGSTKLVAAPPIPMSAVVSEMPNNYGHMISTHYNNHEQSLVQGGGVLGLGGGATDQLNDEDIDFSKAEAFLQLEAPIDARKDQNMLKLAYTIPKRTFMNRILRRYPIHKKRLAFIQRKPLQPKPLEIVGNLVVSAKGGDTKEVSISCQVCGQRFTKQHHFQRHLFIHPDPDNKKFLCQVCGKRFNRADHLNRHALLHGDVKVQKCLLCGEEFDRASHLDRHRRKHHPPAGQQPSQTPPLTPQIKSPPPMGGTFDGLGFVTNIESPTSPIETQGSNGNNLHLLAAVATPDGSNTVIDGQIQMDALQDVNGDLGLMQTPVVMVDQVSAVNTPSIHQSVQQNGGIDNVNSGSPGNGQVPEPDRPYPCMVCGRKFIRSTHLRRHMRIHTGEKPFACHICGRRYARGDYLRAHIQAHRRDKIHKCKHCGDVFRDLTRFADHCRVQHKDVNDEHGNPRPPPENSPPPPPISTVLGDFLTADSAEEITVVPSSIAITSKPNPAPIHTPMMIANPSQNVPITLINLADSQDEVIISSLHHPPLPANSTHLSHHHLQHQLPTSMQTPMTSPDIQLAHIQQSIGVPHQDHHQFLIPNNVPETANEVTIVSQLSKAGAVPNYIDPITQYIISNGNTNNSNMTVPAGLPTPHASPLIDQGLPPH